MPKRIAFLLLLCTAAAFPQTRWERSAEQKRALTKDVVWLTHEPLEFLLRRGDHFDDEPARYARLYDRANLQKMADAGDHYGRIYFYKGFGLEYERANMETAKKAAALMHQLGMKVSIYMAGTMFIETLYRELPEARDWEQRDQWGRPVTYGMQTFRHYPCPNEPAYRDYLKRIARIGVEEVKADEIAFDNIMLQPEPQSCHCARCIRAFHEFLRKRYPTRAVALWRFGLPDVEWVQAPEWSNDTQPDGVTVLGDPVLQEWVRFRAESLARYSDDLADYVHSLNPNVGLEFNIKGLYSFNRYWTNAIYHPLYAGHVDMISFDTGGYEARTDSGTGALVSQIRSYKMTRRLGMSCIESLNDELRAAVHMAFHYARPGPGYIGAPYINGAHNVFTPILEFFRYYNDRYYTGTDNVADVAVLRNWPSMAYSINATYTPATLMEQVLIQYKVPFDILFEEQLDRLPKYAAIVLAGQECVSNTQADALLAYVRNGGTLIVTDNTGQYNEWRERRRVNPLLPARQEGKGHVVFVPRIVPGAKRTARGSDEDPEPGATQRRGERISPAQWVLPANHAEIYRAVADAVHGGLSVRTEAPLTTVMEITTRPATRETLVHFVNFDRQHRLAPFAASVRKPYGSPVKSVTYLSPDTDDPQTVAGREADGRVSFTVPATRLYGLVVIAQ
jgi:hypothetical protein